MFKSILLAGFFWATTNFMPHTAVSPPTAAANILTANSLPAPILMASVPRPQHLAHARLSWEEPNPTPQLTPQEETAAEEEAFVGMINAERTQRGLNALTLDPMLTQTARAHSEEMCTQNYFDHHSPTPGMSSPMDRYLSSLKEMGESQPEYLLVGENIYYCSVFNDIYNVDYAHRALMASPGHRANILEKRFTKIGLGVYRNARGEFWVTEMFSRDTNP
ncbi:MAG: CAP domain-containing protein [Janthinobacterium lividum]